MPSHLKDKRLKKLILSLLLSLSVIGVTACYPKHTEVALDYNNPESYPYYDDYYPYPYYYDHYYGPYYYPGFYGSLYWGNYYYPGYGYHGYSYPFPSGPGHGGRMIR